MAATTTIEAISPHQISTAHYSALSDRTMDLINAEDDPHSTNSRSNWHNFNFKEPIYLFEIRVGTEGFSSYDGFDVKVHHVDGTKHEEFIELKGEALTLRSGKLSSGFSFKPPSKILARPKLKSVVTYGLTLEEFHRYEWAIKDFEKNSTDLRKREATLSELETALPVLRAEKASLDSEVGKSRAQLDKITADTAAKEAALADIQSKVDSAKASLTKIEADCSTANEKLQKAQQERKHILQELKNFPSEIVGFIKQGNRGIWWYVGLGLPFAAALLFLTYRLIFGALDLIQSLPFPSGIDVWSALLVRLPFVLLALAIIEVCGSICARMIFEVVKINRQRIDFAQISIIAKDVTLVSAKDTSLSEDEAFEREVRLRMDLLREHMKNYTGTEFEYRGSNIGAAIVGWVSKFAPSKG